MMIERGDDIAQSISVKFEDIGAAAMPLCYERIHLGENELS